MKSKNSDPVQISALLVRWFQISLLIASDPYCLPFTTQYQWLCGVLCKLTDAQLNRDKVASNMSVPGIHGYHEKYLIKSFKVSPNLICQQVSIKIPLGLAPGSIWIQAGPTGMLMVAYRHIKWGSFESSCKGFQVHPSQIQSHLCPSVYHATLRINRAEIAC